MKDSNDAFDRVFEYSELLESRGCNKFYQGSKEDGGQILLLDGNSGTIFSVEVNPDTNEAEIRTHRKQKTVFPTEVVLDRICRTAPLFSDYTVEDFWDLPLISLQEERNLPYCTTPHERVELLMGAGVDAAEVYRATGKIPFVDDQKIRQAENEFLTELASFNREVVDLLHKKTEHLPDEIIDRYTPTKLEPEDVYVMYKKRSI